MIKKILGWLIVSSADPNKFSLTLKGIGVTLIPVIAALIVGFTGVTIPQTDLVSLLDGIVSLTGIGLTLFGICRKIYLSFVQ